MEVATERNSHKGLRFDVSAHRFKTDLRSWETSKLCILQYTTILLHSWYIRRPIPRFISLFIQVNHQVLHFHYNNQRFREPGYQPTARQG